MDIQSLINVFLNLFSKNDNGANSSQSPSFFENLINLITNSGVLEMVSALDGSVMKNFSEKIGLPIETIANLVLFYSKLKSGELNLTQLLPSLIPVIIEFFTDKKTISENENSEIVNDYLKLEPIERFTDDEIFHSLNDYFENETAS